MGREVRDTESEEGGKDVGREMKRTRKKRDRN
jgi:hypothetical protein